MDLIYNSATNFLLARSQMAVSLGFHIIFAAVGIAMPFFLATAHWLWLRTNNKTYLQLTQAWSKGVAIFFAIGAVSGTMLSFELGLLWPEFMKHAGPIIGLPFSLEGAAFFLEAIALGIFLYGWNKVPKWIHWSSGLIIGISGVLSALFVISANAWMNGPTGFTWINGHATNIDPYRAMFNKLALREGIHMVIAAFAAVGFAVAGIHAARLLKSKAAKKLHQKGFLIALAFGAVAAIIQPISGDLLGKNTAQYQPLKLAAMEGHFDSQRGAPLLLGGFPDTNTERVTHGIYIPKLLSFLAYGDFDAEVKGLKAFPKENWPPVAIVHFSFQIMILLGTIMATIGVVTLLFLCFRRELFFHKIFLRLVALCVPLGFIAIEAGWIVTEVGRQPWIIYNLMKTRDSLTPMPGIIYTFSTVSIIYLLLSFVAIWLLWRQIRKVEGT